MNRIYPTIIILFLIIFGWPQLQHAQKADTVLLDVVTINENKNSVFITGKNIFILDSTILSNYTHQNLGGILANTSGIFIKSYGAGSASTLSSRGTEARHSSVLWNGFNLNSSSLGLADLSMIPIHVTENISVIHGGSTAINGNSSIGSTILLNRNVPQFSKKSNLIFDFESGSFGNRNAAAKIIGSNGWVDSKTTLFYNEAQNDFDFINTSHRDRPKTKLKHAAYQNYGVIQDLDFKIRINHFFSTSAWYQVTRREIPPMMTVPSSEAEQNDSILRFYAGYKIVFAKSALRINGGYFREFQHYNDARYEIHKKYLLNNFFGDADWRWNAGKNVIISHGILFNQSTASFVEYDASKQRQLLGVHISAIIRPIRLWTLNVNLRREFSNTAQPPFAPSLGIEGNLYGNYITLKINAGRHFSIPSLNDLHWKPGGNPDLVPEDALSVEGGLLFFKGHKRYPLISFMAFHTVVDNWIKWTPGSGGIYTPENVAQVKTKGIESSLNYEKQFESWKVNFIFNYTWCQSTLTRTNEIYGQALIGKQLMYSPEHIGGMILSVSYRRFGLIANNTYTGMRYTTDDNSIYLNSYMITDVTVDRKMEVKKHSVQCYVRVSNLFDSTYQVMAYRPTPGRWYSAGLKFNLNLNLK